MSQQPPLNALKAFEAVARHRSFKRAAEELNVTHSAISHQVRALEEHYGQRLLDRQTKQTALTQHGDMLFTVVADFLVRLAAVDKQITKQEKEHLNIMAQSSIAVPWLTTRLPMYSDANPDLSIRLSVETMSNNFIASDFDVIMGTWPAPNGFYSEQLRRERWYPVCSPEMAKRLDVKDPSTLLRQTLYSSERGEDWALWRKQHKIEESESTDFMHFNLALLSVQAATSGKGISLGCSFLADDLVKAGKLVALTELSYDLPWGHYSIHYRQSLRESASIKHFLNWLKAQV